MIAPRNVLMAIASDKRLLTIHRNAAKPLLQKRTGVRFCRPRGRHYTNLVAFPDETFKAALADGKIH